MNQFSKYQIAVCRLYWSRGMTKKKQLMFFMNHSDKVINLVVILYID